jgi:hypothetical protein
MCARMMLLIPEYFFVFPAAVLLEHEGGHNIPTDEVDLRPVVDNMLVLCDANANNCKF